GKESCGPDYPTEGRLSKKDNLAEWNKAQMLLPEKERVIFSLFEISPCNYKELKFNIPGEELETLMAME
ncbi:hypothetical protein KY312_01190, partial [Candidatus Woesearchaeota archaeon]|nr:hypothetical protein [Candidatus Woesearchaeota archaeon]